MVRNSPAGLPGLLTGESVLLGYTSGLIPAGLIFGFLPVVPIFVLSTAIVVLGSLLITTLEGQRS